LPLDSMIKQSLPLMILCGIGEVLAGAMFGGLAEQLENLAGLIVLIPAIMGLKGNIDTTLGSRLSSAAHMGVISTEKIWNPEVKENLVAALSLSVVMSVIAGFAAHATTVGLGLDSIGPLPLIGIALVAGTLAGTFLAFTTIGIVLVAYKRGYDPDNITGPALSTVGDIITLFCLTFSAYIFINMT